jgi:hypothetical protein
MTIIETGTRQAVTGRSLVEPRLFERMSTRIATEHDMDSAKAERILDQALAFLGTCAVTAAPLSPSETVDIGWHTFILYTRDYAEFCDRVAGRFINHVPTDGEEEIGAAGAWETTRAVMAAGYIVDAPMWEGTAKCTGCHNGCHDDPPPNPPEPEVS